MFAENDITNISTTTKRDTMQRSATSISHLVKNVTVNERKLLRCSSATKLGKTSNYGMVEEYTRQTTNEAK